MIKDLNRLSAEVIMEFAEVEANPDGLWIRESPDHEWMLWTPLTDMNQCFQVVEKMQELNHSVNLHEHPFMQEKKNRWSASFRHLDAKDYFHEYGSTPNEAIITAALKAKGVEVE